MYFIGIEAFLTIVENGNISTAAEILHLSQSTVSYRLKTLENELGYKLVKRTPGIQGISLTKQGDAFLVVAEKMMALCKEAQKIKKDTLKIDFTIGAADSISIYLMEKLYKELLLKFDNIQPRIITQHTMETYDSISSRQIDIGFVKRAFSTPNVLVQKIIDEEMVLVRYGNAPEHLIPTTPYALDVSKEIFMDWGYRYQIWHDYWWKPNSYQIRVDAASLIFSMFDNEEQWSIVPRSVFNTIKDRDSFSEQVLSEAPPNRSCYLISHKFNESSKKHIFDFIEDFLLNS